MFRAWRRPFLLEWTQAFSHRKKQSRQGRATRERDATIDRASSNCRQGNFRAINGRPT